jgi:hypothetical protein
MGSKIASSTSTDVKEYNHITKANHSSVRLQLPPGNVNSKKDRTIQYSCCLRVSSFDTVTAVADAVAEAEAVGQAFLLCPVCLQREHLLGALTSRERSETSVFSADTEVEAEAEGQVFLLCPVCLQIEHLLGALTGWSCSETTTEALKPGGGPRGLRGT